MSDQPSLLEWARPPAPEARFDGEVYIPERDDAAWTDQHDRIRRLMADQRWRTVAEIAGATDSPPASASAQLRHMRKSRFGGLTVERRKRAGTIRLYEYRVLPADPDAPKRLHGAESKLVIQELRAEIRELRRVAADACGVLDALCFLDEEEGAPVRDVVERLRAALRVSR